MTADELKKLVGSSDFYDRYDKSKHWDFLPVMAKRAMQSAEFNEIQHIAEEKVKALGNSLTSPDRGDIEQLKRAVQAIPVSAHPKQGDFRSIAQMRFVDILHWLELQKDSNGEAPPKS